MIFSKPFIAYKRQEKGYDMSSRLDTLLKKFGFQNRWKHLLKKEEYLFCDYSLMKDVLQKEQQSFRNFVSIITEK